MNLIKKISKILKDNSLAESYSKYVIDDFKSMKIKINKLKEVMIQLSQTRRKNQANERHELVEQLFRMLRYIEISWDTYEYDFIDLNHLLKLHENMNLTTKINEQVSYALNTKNELKKEFETIYKNFQNMAKKLDDIPMKEVLKRMREVFGFDECNDLTKPVRKVIVTYPSWH